MDVLGGSEQTWFEFSDGFQDGNSPDTSFFTTRHRSQAGLDYHQALGVKLEIRLSHRPAGQSADTRFGRGLPKVLPDAFRRLALRSRCPWRWRRSFWGGSDDPSHRIPPAGPKSRPRTSSLAIMRTQRALAKHPTASKAIDQHDPPQPGRRRGRVSSFGSSWASYDPSRSRGLFRPGPAGIPRMSALSV